jgi:hypothetical protein
MKTLVTLLILIAAASFVVGIIIKLAGIAVLFGNVEPVVLWRFTIGCLGFAIALTLIQIRNLAK